MCQSNCNGFHARCKAIGILALRLALGAIFIFAGYQKLGPGHAGAAMMFSKMIGMPGDGGFWAYFVGAFEVVGGIMVALGAYTRVAAAWLVVIMLVAVGTVHRGGPFPGLYAPLAILGGLFSLIGTGAGRYRLVQTECCCKECKEKMAAGGCCGGNCKKNSAEQPTMPEKK